MSLDRSRKIPRSTPRGPGARELGGLVRDLFRQERREPALVLSHLREHWPNIVGGMLAGRTHPERLVRGTLWVGATDACWAYELQFMKDDLLAAVRAFSGSAAVKELRFSAGASPQPANPPPTTPAPPVESDDAPALAAQPAVNPPSPGEEPQSALGRAAEAIPDAKMRETFRRALSKRARQHIP